MKIKDLKYNYKTDRDTRFFGAEIVTPWGAGREAVHRIETIRRPVRVPVEGGEMTISDVGYTWYQLALRERYFWLSAAFDDTGALIELYFDVTAGNDFTDPENPCFRDLYLDITVAPDGRIRVLDRDELEQALAEGEITQTEHDGAVAHCEALELWLREHWREAVAFCRERKDALCREL